jgi:hypothetical protein
LSDETKAVVTIAAGVGLRAVALGAATAGLVYSIRESYETAYWLMQGAFACEVFGSSLVRVSRRIAAGLGWTTA